MTTRVNGIENENRRSMDDIPNFLTDFVFFLLSFFPPMGS